MSHSSVLTEFCLMPIMLSTKEYKRTQKERKLRVIE